MTTVVETGWEAQTRELTIDESVTALGPWGVGADGGFALAGIDQDAQTTHGLAPAALLLRRDRRHKGKGIVRLPVQRAVELTLQEWQNPGAARSNLISRVEKATALPPAKPNPYE